MHEEFAEVPRIRGTEGYGYASEAEALASAQEIAALIPGEPVLICKLVGSVVCPLSEAVVTDESE